MEKYTFDLVEETVIKLLTKGHSITNISKLLGFDITICKINLEHKGVLYPDGRIRDTN